MGVSRLTANDYIISDIIYDEIGRASFSIVELTEFEVISHFLIMAEVDCWCINA